MVIVKKEKEKYIVALNHVRKLNTLFSELISQQLINLVKVPGNQVVLSMQGVKFIDEDGAQILRRATEISEAVGSVFQLYNVDQQVLEDPANSELFTELEILEGVEIGE